MYLTSFGIANVPAENISISKFAPAKCNATKQAPGFTNFMLANGISYVLKWNDCCQIFTVYIYNYLINIYMYFF